MNVLIVGNGKGSWTIRGEQLGAAIGARVTSYPKADDWTWADVAVLVKRAGMIFASLAHAAGVPIVWDAVDFWRQPTDHHVGRVGALDLLQNTIAAIRPVLVIGATKAMAEACNGVYLPHHSWAGLEPTEPRPDVQVVAYEGNPAYLELWHGRLTEACARRGWRFEVNPADLREVDIFVSFRHGVWDGFMPREWKSGVKVVNAIAAGRPIIGQSSAAITEIHPPSTIVNQPFPDLDRALDEWTPFEARKAAAVRCLDIAPRYRLDTVAVEYAAILSRAVEMSCAA